MLTHGGYTEGPGGCLGRTRRHKIIFSVRIGYLLMSVNAT
jgi:hypothetical protein